MKTARGGNGKKFHVLRVSGGNRTNVAAYHNQKR